MVCLDVDWSEEAVKTEFFSKVAFWREIVRREILQILFFAFFFFF